jgi:DNA topoisomerase-1
MVKKFGQFEVVASSGHLRDLVKSKPGTDSGIDVHNWIAHYDNISGKGKVIDNLGGKIKVSDVVWLASDLDREGEAIAWHLKEMFRIKNYKRISFNEITEAALKEAVANPRDIDYNLVDAQQGRRILDRLIGFKLTQLLWKNFKANSLMTAGRVQSVLLSMICDIERKALEFKTTSYFTLLVNFIIGKVRINECKLCLNDSSIIHIESEKDVLDLMKKLLKGKFIFSDAKITLRSESPPPPFITSTLQQDAYTKLGFSSKHTMKIAQELYESGKITYMRTDSTLLSDEAKDKLKQYIMGNFNSPFVDRNTKSKAKNAQEAHEAIRPAKILSRVQIEKSSMTNDQKKMYDLILKRAVASLMKPASFEELNVKINHSIDNRTFFLGKTSVLVEPGFKEVYDIKGEKGLKEVLQSITMQSESPKAVSAIAKTTWKTPPSRLNEPKVIRMLEKEGIGRPSTYSSILAKLFERQFIEKRNVEGENKQYIDLELDFKSKKIKKNTKLKPFFEERSIITPTETGVKVNDFLVKRFSGIVNPKFTALMETDLDSIASGAKKMGNVMRKFYEPFLVEYKKHANVSNKIVADDSKPTVFKINGKEYIVRKAKFGPVIQEGKHFISLKQYLLDTKKTIDDIKERDVKFLTSLPLEIGDGITLNYGRYGFYLSSKNKNRKIFKNELSLVFTGDHETLRSKMRT